MDQFKSGNIRASISWGCLAAVVFFFGCNDVNEKLNAVIVLDSQFQTTVEKWGGDFAGYRDSTVTAGLSKDSVIASSMQFAFDRARLPMLLDSNKYGLKLQSLSKSDSLFTFIKKKVSGLTPNRTYSVIFEIDLVTNYPEKNSSNTTLQGGLVYLKGGASPVEPVTTLINGYYQFNLDKGKRSNGGTQMVVLGNIANGLTDVKYALTGRSNSDRPVLVKANAQGEIWLCIGTESVFGYLTILTYDKIKTIITEQTSG